MTLFQLDRLPDVRRLSDTEADNLHRLSNHVYDALERFSLAEARRDAMAEVMVEAASKFLEKGL